MSHTVHNTNEACCSIPPVLSNYVPKGSFIKYAGFDRVYVTGQGTALALVSVYDIFGFKPQTQQGADILASQLNARVFMPDFFEPHPPFPGEKFPPRNDQDKADLQAFFGPDGAAFPPKNVASLIDVAKTLKSDGYKFVGAMGFCWGGKVCMLAGSTSGTPLDAISIVHPAMLSTADAENLQVPLGMYISKDEPIDEYKKIVEVISKKPFAAKNDSKHYETMFHGWAAARADLDDPENKKEYENLYATAIKFFENAQ